VGTPNLRAGKLFCKANGTRLRAKGAFTYNLGKDKKSKILGVDTVHGEKVEPVVPFIEGKISDGSDVDLALLIEAEGTFTLELANNKIIVLEGGVYAADADVDTDEGEIPVRWEGESCEEA